MNQRLEILNLIKACEASKAAFVEQDSLVVSLQREFAEKKYRSFCSESKAAKQEIYRQLIVLACLGDAMNASMFALGSSPFADGQLDDLMTTVSSYVGNTDVKKMYPNVMEGFDLATAVPGNTTH